MVLYDVFWMGKTFESVTVKTYEGLSSGDVFFSVMVCSSLCKDWCGEE